MWRPMLPTHFDQDWNSFMERSLLHHFPQRSSSLFDWTVQIHLNRTEKSSMSLTEVRRKNHSYNNCFVPISVIGIWWPRHTSHGANTLDCLETPLKIMDSGGQWSESSHSGLAKCWFAPSSKTNCVRVTKEKNHVQLHTFGDKSWFSTWYSKEWQWFQSGKL